MPDQPHNPSRQWIGSAIATTAICLLLISTVWSILWGRGPLERLVGRAATKMAAIPSGPAATGPAQATGRRLES